jgi:ubiquinone/menaquinone biosynthesis C-methylase UbiE
MTEMELMIDFYLDLGRQGPGSMSDTINALAFTDLRSKCDLKIADIGCGTGSQTLDLARLLNGHVTAVDLSGLFLEKLRSKAEIQKVSHKIDTLEASMEDLPFEEESLDVIWSEGAIYNMGFEAGIKAWKKFLKKGGYLAVSEISWKSKDRPEKLEAHWRGEYPEIDLPSEKIKLLEENGYSLSAFFFLSQLSWIEWFYKPMYDRFEPFLEKHGHSEQAKAIVAAEKKEIRFYEEYHQYYGYGFYIAKRVS